MYIWQHTLHFFPASSSFDRITDLHSLSKFLREQDEKEYLKSAISKDALLQMLIIYKYWVEIFRISTPSDLHTQQTNIKHNTQAIIYYYTNKKEKQIKVFAGFCFAVKGSEKLHIKHLYHMLQIFVDSYVEVYTVFR